MEIVSRDRDRCVVENSKNSKNYEQNYVVNEVKRIIDNRKIRGRPKKNIEESTPSSFSVQSSQTSSTNLTSSQSASSTPTNTKTKTIRRSTRERKTRVL